MLGWSVVVSTQNPEERDSDSDPDRKAKVLASWETGVDGIGWLHRWVENGIARIHSLKGGYPNRYIIQAEHLLPVLTEGTPFSAGRGMWAYDEWNNVPQLIPGNENWSAVTYSERIAVCPLDRLLTVEVWDLS